MCCLRRLLTLFFLFPIFIGICQSDAEVKEIDCLSGFILGTKEKAIVQPPEGLKTVRCQMGRCFTMQFTTDSGFLLHNLGCYGKNISCHFHFAEVSNISYNGCAACDTDECNKPQDIHPLANIDEKIAQWRCLHKYLNVYYQAHNPEGMSTEQINAYCSNMLDQLMGRPSAREGANGTNEQLETVIKKLDENLANLTTELKIERSDQREDFAHLLNQLDVVVERSDQAERLAQLMNQMEAVAERMDKEVPTIEKSAMWSKNEPGAARKGTEVGQKAMALAIAIAAFATLLL